MMDEVNPSISHIDLKAINAQLISTLFDYLKINFFIIDKKGVYLAKNNAYVVPNAERADKIDEKSWLSCLEVMQTEQNQVLEEEYQNSWYLSIKSPLKIDNEVKGVIGISIDITELKRAQAEAALHKLEGMAMVSTTIAHELRTPLASISIAATNLKKALPELLKIYEIARKNNLVVEAIPSRSLTLLNELPNMLEMETSSANNFIDMLLMKIKPTIQGGEEKFFSISECIGAALHRYPFAEEQKILISFENKEDFLVKGNEELLMHVIFNLLKNAIYYISAAGKGNVTIWLQKQKKINKLFFKDTGAGVPAEILPKIFDRFFSKTHRGAGVGLSFCKMAMNSFGGDIMCESVEGEYTLFILTLPVVNRATL